MLPNLPLERQVASLLSRNRENAFGTQKKRGLVLMKVARDLHERFGLQKLENLKLKHVTSIVEGWKAADTGHRTIDGDLSHLRWLVHKIGKANLMPRANKDLGIEPGPRHTRAGKCIPDETFNKWLGSIQDDRIKLMLELARYVGLRFEEASLFRPTRDWDASRVYVKRGTKGGQPRYLWVHSARQHDVLKRAYASTPVDGGVIPAEYRTYEQWRQHVYRELRKVGIGRKNDQTFHDLRRTYAVERMKFLIREKGMTANSAAIVVSRELGHHRTEILDWYISEEDLSKIA